MNNLEYLEKVNKKDDGYDFDHENLEYRQAKALEIIAEQIINLDNTLACVVEALENIETTLKQR